MAGRAKSHHWVEGDEIKDRRVREFEGWLSRCVNSAVILHGATLEPFGLGAKLRTLDP
jgi:hypothetical protein